MSSSKNDSTELRKILQQNLRSLRKQRGMSQQKLAEAAGLSLAYIGGIEIAIKSPSFDSLCAIATALNVQVYQLLLPPSHRDHKLAVFCKDVESEFSSLLKQVLTRY